jgi:hypothetical protein
MKDQASRNFVSVVLLTFPSKIQYDLWYEKYITFYSSKAVDFLKANGQLRQSATLVEDSNDLIRVSLIWIYKNKQAYDNCQKFHGQWAKIGGDFIGKASGYRGQELWGFD